MLRTLQAEIDESVRQIGHAQRDWTIIRGDIKTYC
jgi:hypothetical protein